ncbi:cell division protein ZapA [Oceanobacillus sp. FSL H7-0719]|uniref:cell division protein ZapA n=1 Tax=Oceanobacillus sp. FSL H7-0719 TaxID=2954507 RepID=UPI003253FA17
MTEQKKNKITVEIYNKTYTIVGAESKSHVELVASLVDQKMNEIHRHNKHLDSSKLAVLTAVNTMNDYLKLKEDYATLLGSIHRKEEK